MFAVCPGESGRRGDVVIHPGSLALCAQQSLRDKGVIGDISITCPTAASLTHRAAAADGYAATCREAQKDTHHAGRFSTARWVFTPIVQESFGRLGRRAGALFKELAHHSAHVTGGTQQEIRHRQGYVFSYICSEMATSLAMESAERMYAYMRGARQMGVRPFTVSAVLDEGTTSRHSA